MLEIFFFFSSFTACLSNTVSKISMNHLNSWNFFIQFKKKKFFFWERDFDLIDWDSDLLLDNPSVKVISTKSMVTPNSRAQICDNLHLFCDLHCVSTQISFKWLPYQDPKNRSTFLDSEKKCTTLLSLHDFSVQTMLGLLFVIPSLFTFPPYIS